MYYVDQNNSKSSSGARFFNSIAKNLQNFPEYSEKNYKNVLINISSPLSKFIQYKFLNKKIILRVDGNYSYPITKESIKATNIYLYSFLKFLMKIGLFERFLKTLADNDKIKFIFNLRFNFFNYSKIYFSNFIIYQSSFSKASHIGVFPKKKSKIIKNSTPWKYDNLPINNFEKEITHEKDNKIFLCTSFHKNRPLKGFGDLLLDLEKINFSKKSLKLNLLIFGYIPKCFIKSYSKTIIDLDKFIDINKNWITTFPTFSTYSKDLSKKLISADAYVTYAQLDPCPNFILEALSHGLPIIGCDSGGIPEIVGDCGIILDIKKQNSIYSNLNYEYGLKPPDCESLYKAIIKIKKNSKYYQNTVKNSLKSIFSRETATDLYYQILREFNL